ncbi:transcriptional regulator [Rhodobacteraceae bacterium CCMM004]|nr:transcriptional regulator [Rhodobacteraceae bacterium CCMM004]
MTTDISHHLTEPLLMAYSAGTLPEAFSLVVASHVSLCDECRARLGAYDAVGGAMLEDCGVASLGANAYAETLARIAERPEAPVPPPSADLATFPAPLRDYVGGDLDAVQWRAVGGGVKQAILPTSADASVRLLSIPGGAAMPDHGHRGAELTLVLQGAFHDEDGTFARGDVEVADEHLNHRPVAARGVPCICLAATDAPLRFSGLMPRLAQRFLRI